MNGPGIPTAVRSSLRLEKSHYKSSRKVPVTNYCLILTKTGMCPQILVKLPIIKFRENPFNRSGARTCVQTEGRTDEVILIGAPQRCKRAQTFIMFAETQHQRGY